MKKLILIYLMAILCSCQFTKQQKAEKLIKDYMKQHLNDYNSYQVVNTEKPDTAYKDYLVDDSTGKSLFSLLLAQKGLVNIDDSLLTAYLDKPLDLQSDSYITMSEKRLKKNQQTLEKLVNQIKQFKDSYKKQFKGWSVKQSYRAKNGFGALRLETTLFIIDSAFTKVIDSEEIK
jgi:hypothetical protein